MNTSPYRLALLGFGNVGQGLARSLAGEQTALTAHGARVSLCAVVDPRFGAVADPGGLDPRSLLEAAEQQGSFVGMPASIDGDDLGRILEEAGADVLAELTYTDLATGEPAASHIREALARGIHVTTSNKGPIALHLDELQRLAESTGAILRYEGTVMSGTPALELGAELAVAGIRSITGILNGTTNYMIDRMGGGISFARALEEAQQNGFAEADPSGDLEGLDAAAKLAILSRVVFGEVIAVSAVDRVPLSEETAAAMTNGGSDGRGWRVVSALEPGPSGLRATVAPRLLEPGDGLLGVGGATNAITYHTDLLGPVTLVGPGAGRTETACAILSDLLAIHRRATS